MKILLDQGTPLPLRRHLPAHQVTTIYELGWDSLYDAALISAADSKGFDLLISTDPHLRNWQKEETHRLAILVLLSTSWLRMEKALEPLGACVEGIRPGNYGEIEIPKAA